MDFKNDASSVPELISSVKSALDNHVFSVLEEVLISREKKLTKEIEFLKKDKNLLEEKFQAERLEKMMATDECSKLKDSVALLEKEKDGFNEKLQSIRDDKRTIIELDERNCELECTKLRLETEVRAYKRKFEELETRVISLEKTLNEFKGLEGGKILAANVKIEAHENAVGTVNANIIKEAVHCDRNPRLKVNEGLSFRNAPVRNDRTGSGIPLSDDVLEIMDSDDGSSPSKMLSAKEMDSPGHQENAPSEQIIMENGNAVLKRKRASSVDEGGSSNGGNVNAQNMDESCSTVRDKTTKTQKLVPVTNSSPVEHVRGASMLSGGKNCRRDLTLSNTFELGNFKEEIETNNGLNISKSSLSSSSSSSSSDSDNADVDTSMYSKFGRVQDTRRWKAEADMIAAFETDDELCMKAVCALYRQPTSLTKSTCDSSTSGNRGFEKLAATRAIILAKFLIDGDPEGKLRKSKEELMGFDPNGVDECRKLARGHSKQLLEMLQEEEDSPVI